MSDASDITQIASGQAIDGGSDSLSPDNDKTQLSKNRSSSTLFAPSEPERVSVHAISGFAKAQALASQANAIEGVGSLLKGRFLFEAILGQGGMGTVYKTRDLRKVEAEDPNPYIATKVLNQDFKDHPNAFVALQQETTKSHALAHPNIVTVHDFDRDGDILYMTMELLEGEPLDQLLKSYKSGLPKERAFQIVRDMGAALAYAHQRHIIHADFKPGNVFICESGTAKVLDFGIARAASIETQRHKFDAGQLGALTPAYATIEMVKDDALTFTDDVYALACVTYEILAGHHPYNNVSALEAKQRHMKLKPIAGLKNKEWKALSHALALEKKSRTASVSAFIDELFPTRSPVELLALVALLIVAVGGVSWVAYQQYQEMVKIQNAIAENMSQAQLCFAQSDFACAVERSLVVTNLESDNAAAQQLLMASQMALQKQEQAQAISKLLTEGEACLVAQDDACAQIKARELLVLDANNPRAQQLLAAANNLEQNQAIMDSVRQAEACLTSKDIVCANVFARKASELNENHPAIYALNKKIHSLEQQNQITMQAQQQRVSNVVQQAQDCLMQRKYDCAIKQADVVLDIDPANALAMEVKQTAAVADRQIRDAQDKVNKILAQAKLCLEKQKNYTCAIAKAEAALDILPNNTEAIAIKSRAVDTQRKIKETGFTIK